jgi:hypothetical protein
MSIGNELNWMIVGLFILVAVIILGIIFKPFGEFLQKASLEASPAAHHAVVNSHSNMATSSLDNRGTVDPRKDDLQERIVKEVGEYGHLSHPGKVLSSALYTDPDHGGGVYQHVLIDEPVPAGAAGRPRLRAGRKLLHYNYTGSDVVTNMSPIGTDADTLGNDSSFDSPYSQNRSIFTKGHGHIHNKKWADTGLKVAHSAVGDGPSVIVERPKGD